MLKNILDLKGAQELTKNEQISISGGNAPDCYDPQTETYLCPVRIGREWFCNPC
ncbi:hypothetical protein J3S90_06135 [Flavobacterium sp. P4023]|uniref:Bacteriocin-type signal sequence-containing protein n=1 Tax=Flavobacterium flabelliforme TaxID=2816119 RepID=A0ABS5CRY4_9FLAO|nr:hypothetical protein [Flavobacterium flabelliforme]MBP4141378.1 hypothetical protein [Flavobacterium flabelliforme]